MHHLDIWHIKLEKQLSSAEHQKLYTLLDNNEKKRCDNFANSELSTQFLLSHAYLRRILSHYDAAVPPYDWQFAYNAFGRPEIANQKPQNHLNLRFNLTHTENDAYVIVN